MNGRQIIWKHAVWAWKDGWLLGTMPHQYETPASVATVPFEIPHIPWPELADEDIEDLGENEEMRWKAQGYRVPGLNRKEARLELQKEIWAEKVAVAHCTAKDAERRRQRAKLGEADRTQTTGTIYTLTDHSGTQYKGRLCVSGTNATFVEDNTNFSATWENSQAEKGWNTKTRDNFLCARLREQRQKLSRKEYKRQQKKVREEQLPKTAGDLEVKGEDDKGNLRYCWKGVEVLVTPKEKRTLVENPSAYHRRVFNESTAAQALRMMKQKVMLMLAKGDKGECERIIAKNSASKSNYVSTEDSTWPTHKSPALGKLDDPVVRSHLRDAFSYLSTMQLHYCTNCDEEWPVFTGEWPQGGVHTAGPKAGESETIDRVGWCASTQKPQLCKLCYSSPKRRMMYSKDNKQHLGDRYEALSNLTWFESLLIARVHPVISVAWLVSRVFVALFPLSFSSHYFYSSLPQFPSFAWVASLAGFSRPCLVFLVSQFAQFVCFPRLEFSWFPQK